MLPMTAGRRVALAIGVPLCLALTANTGFNIVANIGRGKFAVDYHIPAGDRRVSVTTSGGNMLLRQVADGPGSLVGTASYSLVRSHVTERIAAGEASYAYDCVVPEGVCEFDPTLTVPGATAVSLSTGGGNVTVERAAGDLALSTGGGDVQATGVAATQVSADTGGGNIEIVFTKPPRDVEVSTGGGGITIVVPPGSTQYHVISSTGGGSVNDAVPQSASSPDLITATSGGGDITIREGT